MYEINLLNAHSKQVDGFLFHWVKQNKTSPYLLFMAGSSHGAWCYENYFHYFYDLGYNIASVDWPGRGGMPAGHYFCNMNTQDIVNATLKAIGSVPDIKNYIIVGHSIGCLASGKMACISDKVIGLVLLAPSPHGQIKGVKKLPPVATNKPTPREDKGTLTKRYWPHITDKAFINVLYDKMIPESPTLKNERFNASVMMDWQENKCPVLVIEAGLDHLDFHPKMQDRKIAEFYQAQYIYIKHMGHCMMYGDDWQDSALHIKNWLATVFDINIRG